MSPVPSLRARLLAGALSAGLMAIAAPAAGQALPTGGAVVAGAASIGAPSAGTLTVSQTSQRAVVDWKSFSVGAGGTVQFQQSPGGAILNRVTGADASVIAGALRANGAVYLINPNGMAITKDGVVDARGGFIGSTLGIKTADFMAGRNIFSGGPAAAAVRNDGTIQVGAGGFVGLLGGQVSSDGVIVAPQGSVTLAAGQAATLDLNGDGFLQVLTEGDVGEGLRALSAADAKAALRGTVNVPGDMSAQAVSGRDGAVSLTAGPGSVSVGGLIDVSGETGGGSIHIDGGAALSVSGTLKADGGRTGGLIDLTGNDVQLSGAQLSARGSDRGGLVRVGGEFQGGRAQDLTEGDGLAYVGRFGPMAALRSAQTLSVDAGSRIDVSSAGDGGTTVLWSERRTAMGGAILAGSGAVEVSSKLNLAEVHLGRISLNPRGRLLLDPKNIIIGDGSNGDPPDAPGGAHGFGDNTGQDSVLWSTDVGAFLGTGASLTLQASNDIYVLNPILAGFGQDSGHLTLQAGRTVEIDTVIQTLNGGLTVLANAPASAGVVDADRDPGSAELNVQNALLLMNSGPVSLTLGTGAGNTNFDGDTIHVADVQSSDVTITNQVVGGRIIFTQPFSSGGNLTLTGNIRLGFSGSDFVVNSFNWTDEGTATITSESSSLFRVIDPSGIIRVGRLTFSDPTRLALGPDTSATYSRVYGDADPTATQDLLHIVSGSLQGADTLADILTPGSLVFHGPGDHAAAGASSLTLGPSNSIDFATGETGYWIDTRGVSQALTITPKTITASLSGASYTYGSPSDLATLTGLLSGDSVSLAANVGGIGASVLTDSGTGYALGQRTGVGAHSVSLTGLSGSEAGNYSLDLTGLSSVNVTITPRTLTYSGANTTGTYGTLATAPTVGLSGIIGGDTVSSTGTELSLTATGAAVPLAARTHAGTYLARSTGLTGADAANYVLATDGLTNPTLSIGRLQITYFVQGGHITYGNAPSVVLGGGVLAGDDVSGVASFAAGNLVAVDGSHPDGFQQTGSFATWSPHTDVGDYKAIVQALSGANAGDYSIAAAGNTDALIHIDQRALTLSATGGTFVYGTAAATTSGMTGLVSGDDVQVALTTTDSGGNSVSFATNTPVGVYSVSATGISGADAANYSFNPGSANITITPKPITYTVGGGTAVYGAGGLSAGTVTLSGVLAADVASIGSTVGVVDSHGVATNLTALTDAGTYTARVTALTSSSPGLLANYTLASSGNTDGSLVITPRPLTLTMPNQSLAYGGIFNNGHLVGGATVGNGYTLTGFAGGDSAVPVWSLSGSGGPVAVTQTGAGTAIVPPTTDAGSYQLALASLNPQGGFKASNYTVNASGGAITITPKALTYVVGAQTAPYGSTSLPGATLTGALPGDNVTASGLVLLSGGGSVPFDPHTPVGTYNVGVTALSGTRASNYTLASSGNSDGTLTIVPKALTWSVADVSAVYGDHPTPGAATLIGVLAGDTVSAGVTAFQPGTTLPTLLQSCNGSPCAQPVSLNPLAPALNAGVYPVFVTGLTGASASNYTLVSPGAGTQVVGHISFAARPITLKLNDSSAAYSRTPTDNGFSIISGSFVNAGDAPVTTPGPGLNLIQYTLPNMPLDVGTYALSGQVVSPTGNYVFTVQPGTLVITPLRITATVGSFHGTYGDATTDAFASQVNAGFAAEDGGSVGAVNYSLTTPNPLINGHYQVGQGPWTISVAVNDPNYQLVSQTSGQLFVERRTIGSGGTIQAVYGDSISNLTPTGVLAGDDIHIGIRQISSGSTTLDISRSWDAAGHVTGFGDVPEVGTYRVSDYLITGASQGNYSLDFAGSVQVTPRTITITSVGAQSLTYGTTPIIGGLSSTVNYSNLVFGGDQFRLVPVMADFSSTASVGSYDWQAVPGALLQAGCTNALADCTNHNYVLASSGNAAAHVTVLPRQLTWSVADASTTYGTAVNQTVTLPGVLAQDASAVQAVLGFFVGDDLRFTGNATSSGAGAFSASVSAPAGAYAARVNGLTGAAASNYTLSLNGTTGQLTVARRPVTYTTASATSYYGLPGNAIGDSLAHFGDYTLAGVLPGDQVALSVGLRLGRGDIDLARALDDLNHGGFSPGAYPIIGSGLTGAAAANYVLASSGNTQGVLTSLDFTALNGLALLNKPATLISNIVKIDQATTAKSTDPLITTQTDGAGGSVTASAGPLTGTASGSAGAGTDGAQAGGSAGASLSGSCGQAICHLDNTLSAWLGVSAALDHLAIGATLDNTTNWGVSFDCGSATCDLNTEVNAYVSAIFNSQTVFNDTTLSSQVDGKIGTGVDVTGSGQVSGSAGSIGGGATAGIGAVVGAGGGGSINYKDGVLQYDVNFDIELVVELHLDINFGINVEAWSCALSGCDHSYQVIKDPVYADERTRLAADYQAKIDESRSSEQSLVEDVLSGKFNNNPQAYAYAVKARQQDEQALVDRAKRDGFSLSLRQNGNSVITDDKPPEMVTVTTHDSGIFEF